MIYVVLLHVYIFVYQEKELEKVKESSEAFLKEIVALKEEKVIPYSVTWCVCAFIVTLWFLIPIAFSRYRKSYFPIILGIV